MSYSSFGVPEISLCQLKTASYVARYHNVSTAARELNRSQTAVTKAIINLEATLNKSLFDRSSHGMAPTTYGQALTTRVNQAIKEMETAGMSYKEFFPEGRDYKSIPVFSLGVSYKRLAAFIALIETGNINSASIALNVSRTTIYNSIRQLEELLGLELFQREHNCMSPTFYCSILFQHIKLAFREIRHAIDDLAGIDGITQGKVVIGTLPYTRTYLIPKAINMLLEAHPDIDIKTIEGPYNRMAKELRNGDIDFIVGAIRPTDEDSDMVVEELFEDKLSVIARKGHPLENEPCVPLEMLQELQWILPTAQTPTRILLDETFRNLGMHTPEHAIETSSLSMIRGLLVDSDRVTLLSEHQIYYEKIDGILSVLPLCLDNTYRPIGITRLANTHPSPVASFFLDKIRQVANEINPGITRH